MAQSKDRLTLEIALDTRAFYSPIHTLTLGGPSLEEVLEYNNSLQSSDGIHLFPFYGNIWSGFRETNQSGVLSVNQPFRSETSLVPALRCLPNIKESAKFAGSFMLFPERVASLDPMLRYEQQVNPDLVEVIYLFHGKAVRNGEEWDKTHNESQYEQFEDFRNPVLLLQPEIINRIGGNSLIDVARKVADIGYTGFSVNTHHLLRKPTQGFRSQFTDFGTTEEIIDFAVRHATILEVSPSLADVGTNHKRPWIEDPHQQYMLKSAKKNKFKGEIVVTFPNGSLIPMEKSGIDVSGFMKDLRDYMYSDKN